MLFFVFFLAFSKKEDGFDLCAIRYHTGGNIFHLYSRRFFSSPHSYISFWIEDILLGTYTPPGVHFDFV